MTFSIVAADKGWLGAAISTRTVGVGGTCLFLDGRWGVVSSQSWTNPLLGVWALEEMSSGTSAPAALNAALGRDPKAQLRQAAVCDISGEVALHSGGECVGYYGHRAGKGYGVAGNMLTGPETLDAMTRSMDGSSGQPLPERLLGALRSGQDAGGDKRGRQSAALVVSHGQPYPYLDLRVDEHPDPVSELERIFALAQTELVPFVESFPTLDNPAGDLPDEVRQRMIE